MRPKYALDEIERRWLVAPEQMPSLLGVRARRLEDRYLSGGHLRLRRVLEDGQPPVLKLGKKYESPASGAQAVVSTYLDDGEYAALRVLPGRSAVKTRYTVQGGALDVYEQPAHGLLIFEVEFESAALAARYVPPPFVGAEVTGLATYSGFALASEAL